MVTESPGGQPDSHRKGLAIFVMAAAVGGLGGLLGTGFQIGIDQIQNFLVGAAPFTHSVAGLSTLQTLLVPTLGGLVAGLLLWLVRSAKAPFGITDIIGLVALRSGTIRIRASLVQILSSACTIGSGGSIGKEGANSQIAATLAASIARMFRVNSRSRAVLLGCGVAAGMACSYNAPIAASIFVMEAVLGNFAVDVFAPVVVASVFATMVRSELLPDIAIYGTGLPQELDLSPQLIIASLLLGAICGVGAIWFRWSLKVGRRVFTRVPVPVPVTLALGGLGVGVIGLWQPQVWGNGFEVIGQITDKSLTAPAALVAMLFLWKVVATVLTVGSGGLGGIFTPNLVVGAAFGALFATAIAALPGGEQMAGREEQITFAFVGMAGLCAGLTHAPITAVVLVFELTRHYELTLPLMLCSMTASIVSRLIDSDSYYNESLRAKGQEIPTGIEETAMRTVYVRDVMRRDFATVRDTDSFEHVMEVLGSHPGDTIYVLDQHNGLGGAIQLQDVKNFINDPTLSSVVIAHDLTRPAISVAVHESLAQVMVRFEDPEINELAVTTSDQPPRLLGRVTRRDLLTGISDEVLGTTRRARLRTHDQRQSSLLELPPGWELAEVPVPEEWAGLAIDAIPEADLAGILPVLVVTRRAGTVRQPATPEQVLEVGARLLVIARSDALRKLQDRTASS